MFAAVIFASAFLIFLVQPMVGKRILPWFGGAPAVWTLCLAFYQTTLFAGYAYAHCLIRYVPPSFHLPLHGLLLAGALFTLPVLPSQAWMPAGGADPNRAILTMLTARVALPFLALALHASNRRLDLTPLVARLGESIGFSTLAIATGELEQYLSDFSVWVFLSRDPDRIRSLARFATERRRQIGIPDDAIQFQVFSAAEITNIPLWTDDYSDLYGVMLPIPIGSNAEP